MKLEEGLLLRIYLDENDKLEGHTAYRWIVNKAMESEMRGATVLRGLEGYGTRQKLHSANLLTLSTNLPVVIEIIDEEQKIIEFVETINQHLTDGLISLERVRYKHLSKDHSN